MATPIRIESADEVALAAILDRHAELRQGLEERSGALRRAIALGIPHLEPLSELVAYIKHEVLPHASAEEALVYPLAGPQLRVLAEALAFEHRDLEWRSGALTAALAGARPPVDALALAEGFAGVFGVHVAKENEHLLPALAEAAGVSLAAVLREMEGRLAEQRQLAGRQETATEDARPPEVLDVRLIEHGHRHDVIFDKLAALVPGERLVIVNDHDPKPLHYQLDAAWPATYGWEYLESGPDLWRIVISRLR